jgi:hypothetical protein
VQPQTAPTAVRSPGGRRQRRPSSASRGRVGLLDDAQRTEEGARARSLDQEPLARGPGGVLDADDSQGASAVLSALLPALVLASVLVLVCSRHLSRRRAARLRLSGGRKALAMYLADRGP